MKLTPFCPYCRTPSKYVNNSEIYGRSYGKWPYAWLCVACDAYVGCHPGTSVPLGSLANAHTRMWRKRAKEPFLKLVESDWHGRRSPAYQWLAKELSIPEEECHFGMFSAEQCELALAAVTNKINQQGEANVT